MWQEILRKGKSRHTGLTIDNSHPITSQYSVWRKFINQSIKWYEQKEEELDYFKSGNQTSFRTMGKNMEWRKKNTRSPFSRSMKTWHSFGKNKPERRMDYIGEVGHLLRIDKSSERFFAEVVKPIWPSIGQKDEPIGSIWSKD